MGLHVLISSRRISMMACVGSSPCEISASTRVLKSTSASATAVFSTISADEQLASDPTALNSKRLPVKAKGDVRLRSVLSISSCGIRAMSSSIPFLPSIENSSSLSAFSICSSRLLNCLPRNDEMIAGGASLPPNRWALVALIIDAFKSPLCRYTPISVSTIKTTNRKFSSCVLPGACNSTPVSVERLQLLCFPLPLTPAKGFS